MAFVLVLEDLLLAELELREKQLDLVLLVLANLLVSAEHRHVIDYKDKTIKGILPQSLSQSGKYFASSAMLDFNNFWQSQGYSPLSL